MLKALEFFTTLVNKIKKFDYRGTQYVIVEPLTYLEDEFLDNYLFTYPAAENNYLEYFFQHRKAILEEIEYINDMDDDEKEFMRLTDFLTDFIWDVNNSHRE